MIRVGILGATGYTALELIQILLRHDRVQITCLTSRDEDRPSIADVHTRLRGRLDLELCPFEADDFANRVDFAFSCLPHAASASAVNELLERGLKVVDFSADYRLNDVATFEQLYQVEHPDPARVGSVPYGLPELFRESIREAQLVANPGCFPTSAILPLAPLLKKQMIAASQIIVDSKTGISGAGRKAALKFHFPEANESVSAYGIGSHRHGPEMSQLLERFTDQAPGIVFTPHLIPMDRGILSTLYVSSESSAGELSAELKSFYDTEPFVRVSDTCRSTKDVSGTNYCDVSVHQHSDMIAIVSVLDNLIKGASGAAVQNFNLMSGFPETTALV